MKVKEKRICVYCGHITSDRLELLSLSCCPDSWYMPLKEYNKQKKIFENILIICVNVLFSFIFALCNNYNIEAMQTSDRIFRRKVQQQFPEIAERVVEPPVLSDVNEIADLYQVFISLVRLPDHSKSSEIADFRTLFIAVALRLYDPDYVNGYKKKVRNGLRSMIATLFKIDYNYVSTLFALAVARVQIYKSMADNVDRIYSVILQSIENE